MPITGEQVTSAERCPSYSPEAAEWDAIVVGTGMGGATLGYALARGGKRVLFCERGSLQTKTTSLRGDYAEVFRSDMKQLSEAEISRRAGRTDRPFADVSAGRPLTFTPIMGAGGGGSSALFGMVLERFWPEDFDMTRYAASAPGASLAPWPITYAEFEPYYEAAEELYRVRGTDDPLFPQQRKNTLLPPPPFLPVNQAFVDYFAERELHPYFLPLACEFVPGCQGCQNFLCACGCKNDSQRICLEPALERFGAGLLDNCEVIRLECEGARVTRVHCRHEGRPLVLAAPLVILAAGALATPEILFRSASDEAPAGLANSSGLLGKNLMRHMSDLYAVWPKRRYPLKRINLKQVGFNDWYRVGDEKLGTVQTFGPMLPGELLLGELEMQLRNTRFFSALAPCVRLPKPWLARLLNAFLPRVYLFASLLEDFPYPENRVLPSTSAGAPIAFSYTVRDNEKTRIASFRKKMSALFRPFRFFLIKQAENNLRLAHACGTARFGTDPRTSVLDRNNKAHEVENLYIVDASFFPSSSGTNPALTIAANALRVAEHILHAS